MQQTPRINATNAANKANAASAYSSRSGGKRMSNVTLPLSSSFRVGNLGVSFTPRESGQHFVNVRRGNKHIPGSPFMINVLEREIGDATKVKVTGTTLKEGKTHVANEFVVDTKQAGYGGLSLSVEGPSKVMTTQ